MTKGLRRFCLLAGSTALLALSGCSWFGGGGAAGNALKPDKFENQNPPGTILSRHQLGDEHQPMYNQVRVMDVDPNNPQTMKVELSGTKSQD